LAMYLSYLSIALLFLSWPIGICDVFCQNASAENVASVIKRGLPKTGQVTSYQRGDDGDYKKGWSGNRFINNGDGTITDNATGLMWVANPASAGVGGTYTWDDAIAACKNLKFAGYGDWRLPNIKELVSIVDYGAHNPSIDPAYFVGRSDNFWSSTTIINNTPYAWYVYFGFGSVLFNSKAIAYRIRPVRAGQ